MSHACVNGVVDVLVAMFVHCSLLERCRTRLSVSCPWLRSATMELYVKCQLCEPCPYKCRDGTNICIFHKEKGCSHFDCGHYILLSSSGLSCEYTVDAVPDPGEKLDPWVQVRKKLNSIYMQWIRRIWNSRLADSSVARNTFVGYSIPIKTWICPSFTNTSKVLLYAMLFLSLINFVWLPEKGKKTKEKQKKEEEDRDIWNYLPSAKHRICRMF